MLVQTDPGLSVQVDNLSDYLYAKLRQAGGAAIRKADMDLWLCSDCHLIATLDDVEDLADEIPDFDLKLQAVQEQGHLAYVSLQQGDASDTLIQRLFELGYPDYPAVVTLMRAKCDVCKDAVVLENLYPYQKGVV
jgi:hypothetical protein